MARRAPLGPLGPRGLALVGLLLLAPLLLAAPHNEDQPEARVVLDDGAAAEHHHPGDDEVDEDAGGAARGHSFFDLSRGYQRLGKKMILPLLVGILLKVASFVPIILGKLSLLALASIVASKLALLISLIIGTKKLSQAALPYSSHSYHGGGDWDSAASNMYSELTHPGAAAAAAAYGAAAAFGGHPSAMTHRRVAAGGGHGHGGQGVPGALASLAAQLGRGLSLDRLEAARSLSTPSAPGSWTPASDPVEPLPTPTPTSSVPTTPTTPERRRRRAAAATARGPRRPGLNN